MGSTTTTTTSTRYQSSVAPHFPMKTMLTPRGPMTAALKQSPSPPPSSASASSVQHHHQHHHHNHHHSLHHHLQQQQQQQQQQMAANGFSPSSMLDANGSMATAFAQSTAPGANSGTAVVCKVPKFLRSLYSILQTEDPSIIAWLQNQELKPNRVTAFHILDMDRFEVEILPKYFKHQKFASFQRQLNNFGFRKWTKTQSSGVCTFSHNSFPPDPNHTGVMRASIREQWRQKSSVVCPSSLSDAEQPPPPRRRVGNGITKADARKSRRQMSVQIPQQPEPSSFVDLYKSPLNALLICGGDGRAAHHPHQQLYAPSHQPAMKKLARPQDFGLEAFDESYKYILPPLQQQHMLTNTPRGFYSALHEGEPTTPSLGGFPHARSLGGGAPAEFGVKAEYNLKPYDYAPEKHHQSMDASFAGAFLEPWSWDANMNSALELGSFPLDFDWQDAANSAHAPHLANVSVSVAVAPLQHQHQHQHQLQQLHSKDALCHPAQDRAMPSAEELGLDPFLFAE